MNVMELHGNIKGYTRRYCMTSSGYELELIGTLRGYTWHISNQLDDILKMGTLQMANSICTVRHITN